MGTHSPFSMTFKKQLLLATTIAIAVVYAAEDAVVPEHETIQELSKNTVQQLPQDGMLLQLKQEIAELRNQLEEQKQQGEETKQQVAKLLSAANEKRPAANDQLVQSMYTKGENHRECPAGKVVVCDDPPDSYCKVEGQAGCKAKKFCVWVTEKEEAAGYGYGDPAWGAPQKTRKVGPHCDCKYGYDIEGSLGNGKCVTSNKHGMVKQVDGTYKKS